MDLTPTAAATRPTVPSTPKGVDPGMVKAAREFEAIFVQQLVKAMRQASSASGPGLLTGKPRLGLGLGVGAGDRRPPGDVGVLAGGHEVGDVGDRDGPERDGAVVQRRIRRAERGQLHGTGA